MKKFLTFFSVTFLLSACSAPLVEKDLSDWIVVNEPNEEQAGSCPLQVKGEARGPWYFEASFPVTLLDDTGTVLAQTHATAQGDWMTEDFVPFYTELYYAGSSTEGTLVLENDNPSGLPENALKWEFPVKLEACEESVLEEREHSLVETYIRENIGFLSPTAPVLGGSWYVVSVDFTAENQVHVVYEDGHLQEELQASYEVSDSGQVELRLL